ncbi:hypothetical protein PsAD2_01957 [Pseudovibrio axinellae]|uniref:DUF930 domain-containing protein n=1 Tax=Pseudovibrio axinellae TaxID=989403 RepID=A0A165Z131_9HYPH|nr:DUF930 domain-containing protein [Pseudovibrio axinellae]KZL19418.1 hypothetical protein PsAD2_01957 [Pseudovibrio axinellae]SER59349.1 protein of unknown function [Pseudovibrio axinellae]
MKDTGAIDSFYIPITDKVDDPLTGSGRFHAVLLLASLATHLLVYWVLAMTSLPRARKAAPVKSIGVEFITGKQLDQLFSKPAAQETPVSSIATQTALPDEPVELPSPVPVREREQGPERIVVRKFQLGTVLNHPKNKELRESLVLFDPSDQREQLCNLEVMEQLQIWDSQYKPERVVAFAYGDVKVTDNTINAQGAAFRSAGKWYRLQYTCTFDAANNQVTAMDFLGGDLIPRSQWEEHFLFAH